MMRVSPLPGGPRPRKGCPPLLLGAHSRLFPRSCKTTRPGHLPTGGTYPGGLGGCKRASKRGSGSGPRLASPRPSNPLPGSVGSPQDPPADQRGNVTRPTPGQAGRSVPRGPSRFGSSGAGAGGRRGRSVRGSCGSGSELPTMVRYPGNWRGEWGCRRGIPVRKPSPLHPGSGAPMQTQAAGKRKDGRQLGQLQVKD